MYDTLPTSTFLGKSAAAMTPARSAASGRRYHGSIVLEVSITRSIMYPFQSLEPWMGCSVYLAKAYFTPDSHGAYIVDIRND